MSLQERSKNYNPTMSHIAEEELMHQGNTFDKRAPSNNSSLRTL